MDTFSIKIIDRQLIDSDGMPACVGEIQIGDYKETFEMPLEWWTMENYEEQWQAGIERLKTHDQSCLVFEIQDFSRAVWVNSWILYKEGAMVHIQNKVLRGDLFIQMLHEEFFNNETCYNFITPRKTISSGGLPLSEWTINLQALIRYKV